MARCSRYFLFSPSSIFVICFVVHRKPFFHTTRLCCAQHHMHRRVINDFNFFSENDVLVRPQAKAPSTPFRHLHDPSAPRAAQSQNDGTHNSIDSVVRRRDSVYVGVDRTFHTPINRRDNGSCRSTIVRTTDGDESLGSGRSYRCTAASTCPFHCRGGVSVVFFQNRLSCRFTVDHIHPSLIFRWCAWLLQMCSTVDAITMPICGALLFTFVIVVKVLRAKDGIIAFEQSVFLAARWDREIVSNLWLGYFPACVGMHAIALAFLICVPTSQTIWVFGMSVFSIRVMCDVALLTAMSQWKRYRLVILLYEYTIGLALVVIHIVASIWIVVVTDIKVTCDPGHKEVCPRTSGDDVMCVVFLLMGPIGLPMDAASSIGSLFMNTTISCWLGDDDAPLELRAIVASGRCRCVCAEFDSAPCRCPYFRTCCCRRGGLCCEPESFEFIESDDDGGE